MPDLERDIIVALVAIQEMISDVCPVVIDKMSTGMRNIRGKRFRIWCTEFDTRDGVEHILSVTEHKERRPGSLTLLQSASLMNMPDRTRLLADLWDIL